MIGYAAEHEEFYYEEIVLRTKLAESVKGTHLYYGVVYDLALAYYRVGSFVGIYISQKGK
jgi:hypothetical protein